jgi:hypothetical protein
LFCCHLFPLALATALAGFFSYSQQIFSKLAGWSKCLLSVLSTFISSPCSKFFNPSCKRIVIEITHACNQSASGITPSCRSRRSVLPALHPSYADWIERWETWSEKELQLLERHASIGN